ncbi:helix-turn-helix domain-containing protein [Acidaminococcus timonensis]|uniref:helix-turn-helix domain-containing protein n=1 Tax=Acidaminococcus timonensis TaxID=1871002 RepID=UPI0025928F4D|nr:helix-turn-helix domain-containing protein [uncultured Acidaminococcus sp.]
MEALAALQELGRGLESMQNRLDELEKWKETVNLYPEIPGVLSAGDVAAVLNCSIATAYGIFRAGKLKTIRHGKVVRCTKEAFLQWMAEGGDGNDSNQ